MNRNTILSISVLVIAVIAVLVYMNGSGSATQSDVSVVEASKVSPDAQYVLTILSKMKQVKLEDPIFNDEAFKLLNDNTVTFDQEEVGRSNPFAPLGTSNAIIQSSSSKR